MMTEDKQALIDLILWYRDEYHKIEFGHNELIQQIKDAKTQDQLSIIEQIVDSWLD